MICFAVTTWLIADLKVLKISVQTSNSPGLVHLAQPPRQIAGRLELGAVAGDVLQGVDDQPAVVAAQRVAAFAADRAAA